FSTFELALQVTAWPRVGSPVRVETGVVHLGNSSIRFMHRMSDPVDGREFARLSQFGVQLDLDTRRPAALPEALRSAAPPLPLPVAWPRASRQAAFLDFPAAAAGTGVIPADALERIMVRLAEDAIKLGKLPPLLLVFAASLREALPSGQFFDSVA